MEKKTFLILLSIVVLVNSSGLFCDIFMEDSSLYAIISKSFAVSGNYMDIYVNGSDWLDKPHFPFWVCSLFIKIFGINSFAYKLPSLLFFLLGLTYTFKLAKELYNKEVAWLATLITGSALHIILSNNDVRAESILLGLIIPAMYYLYKLSLKFSIKNVILGSLFSAAAVMTKGVFILIILYSALFLNMLIRHQVKDLFRIRWIVLILLTFVFVTPELYAIYNQFDLHPEKVVFGTTNVSGIKFFFWDSQFGRFFNSGPIKGEGDHFFFIHTLLWAFAPWAILGFTALGITIRNLFYKEKNKEYLTFFGFIIMFTIFSLSGFQLPHYTNILFPLLSIMVATLVWRTKSGLVLKIIKYSINTYVVVFAIFILLLEYYFKTERLIFSIFIIITLGILFIYYNFRAERSVLKYIILGILSTLLVTLFLNVCFYPRLLKYQSGSQLATYTNEHYPGEKILVNYNDWILQYYTKNQLVDIRTIDGLKNEVRDKSTILIANEDFLGNIKSGNLSYNIIKVFEHFHITTLSLDFIQSESRAKAISNFYLLEIKSLSQNPVH